MFDIFKKDDPLLSSHVKNLLEVALSDGKYDAKEEKLLKSILKRSGRGGLYIAKVKSRMDEIEFVMPGTDNERFDQIYDLITMMMADGDIDENELRVCNKYAVKLGFDLKLVEELVFSIRENINVGHSIEETRKRIRYMLKS